MNDFPARSLEVPVNMGHGATAEDVRAVLTTTACPYCRALPGRNCTDPKSGRVSRVHTSRVMNHRGQWRPAR